MHAPKNIRNIWLCKRSNAGIKQTRTTKKYRTTDHSTRLCYNPYCTSCWTHKVLAITLFIPGTHRTDPIRTFCRRQKSLAPAGIRTSHRPGRSLIYYTDCTMLTPFRAPSNRNRKRDKLPNLTKMRTASYTRVTLPHNVTPYRDSMDGTRDRVAYQKLVTRSRYGFVRCAVGIRPSHQRDDKVKAWAGVEGQRDT